MEVPTNLREAIVQFRDKDAAREFMEGIRWPNGPVCPRTDCGSTEILPIRTRHIYRCKACKREFSVKTGTVFEESPIGFEKWLPAMWLLASNKNGISSLELSRAIEVTQKTAWFMLHRLRLAMDSGTFDKLHGHVEADETYIGGKGGRKSNLGRASSKGRKPSGPQAGKTTVMGILQRGGAVRAFVVPNVKRETLIPKVIENVAPGSTVYTDELRSYHTLRESYVHEVINHAYEYVRGNVHTNSIESFWALLKRGLTGTYIHADPMHLDRYVAEQVFRFNTRELHDTSRFVRAIRATSGKRLTYRDLTKRWAMETQA